MKIAFFDSHAFERPFFEEALAEVQNRHVLACFEVRLSEKTALLAGGFDVVCAFVNDHLDRLTIERLKKSGVSLIALRCAGFNNVDLAACAEYGMRVVRVPSYSPHAVAEHALALLMTLNRRTHRAYQRVREFNFSLDGLVGVDICGKTVGIVGTGKIGAIFATILAGMGAQLLAYDPMVNEELQRSVAIRRVGLDELFERSDIISLHAPLTDATHHLVDAGAVARMKRGVLIINTGRGALIETRALIDGLKSGQVGGAALDVYEEEEGVFFRDLSNSGVGDDQLARLLSFPQVIVTSHQGFLTREALQAIARTTVESISAFEDGAPLANEVTLPPV